MSGSSSSSSRGGAPKAAEGGLLVDKVVGSRALGLGIRGGCSGLGAAAGVLGIVENVFTVTTSGDEFGARVTVLFVLTSLMEKSRRQEMFSRSSGE